MRRHALELVIILAVVAVAAAFLARTPAEPEDLNAEALYHYTRGVKHARQQEYRQAIEEYSAALAILPDYLRAYRARGQAWLGLGCPERALTDYDNGLARVQGVFDRMAYGPVVDALSLDRARLRLVRGDYPGAQSDALSAGDEFVGSTDVAACADYGLGNPELAELRLETARTFCKQMKKLHLQEKDVNMGFLLHLARVEEALGETAKARRVLTEWEQEGSPSPHGLEGPCLLCREKVPPR